jgi:hypothetical protein
VNFRTSLLGTGIVVALIGFAVPALAQASAADRETARQLMDEGDRKTAAKDVEGAVDAYRRANELMHVPSTGIELARAYERTGRFVEARDAALEVTRHEPQASESKLFAPARAAAAVLAASLAERLAYIQVNGVPAAASVKVDGTEVPSAARGVWRAVNPGAHTIAISMANCTPITQQLVLSEKERREVADALVCAAPIVVVTTPPEQIGAPNDTATARNQGPTAPLPPRRTSPAVYIGYGAGALGLGVGVAAGVLSLSKTNSIKANCVDNLCPPRLDDDRRSANTLAWISNVGFVAGAVGAVVGTVFLLSGKAPTEPKRHALITPTLAFDSQQVGAGLHIVLR